MAHLVERRLPNLAEYSALRSSVGWRIHPDEVVERSLSASVAGAVATQDGLAVGMGRAVGDDLYRLIVDVVVDPVHQRQGVGRSIVECLISQLSLPYQPIIGLVADPTAAAFYESCGLENKGDPYFTVIR